MHTYTDKYMLHFVRQNVKSGKVGAFKQYYKIKNSNIIISNKERELNINKNVSLLDVIEKCLKYIKQNEKK